MYGALVLKGEAKFKVENISTASQKLTTANFHSSAYKVYPSGQTRILGIASAVVEGICSTYFIDCNNALAHFSQRFTRQ